MKRTLKLLGIVAAVAVMGLSMMSCGDDCGDCFTQVAGGQWAGSTDCGNWCTSDATDAMREAGERDFTVNCTC